MKSLACGALLAAFLLVSTPSLQAAYTAPIPRIVYVIDEVAPGRRRRRRNHYSGDMF